MTTDRPASCADPAGFTAGDPELQPEAAGADLDGLPSVRRAGIRAAGRHRRRRPGRSPRPRPRLASGGRRDPPPRRRPRVHRDHLVAETNEVPRRTPLDARQGSGERPRWRFAGRRARSDLMPSSLSRSGTPRRPSWRSRISASHDLARATADRQVGLPATKTIDAHHPGSVFCAGRPAPPADRTAGSTRGETTLRIPSGCLRSAPVQPWCSRPVAAGPAPGAGPESTTWPVSRSTPADSVTRASTTSPRRALTTPRRRVTRPPLPRPPGRHATTRPTSSA